MDYLTKELLNGTPLDQRVGGRAFRNLSKQASPLIGALAGAPIGGAIGYHQARSGSLLVDEENRLRKKRALKQKVTKMDLARVKAAKEAKDHPGKLTLLTALLGGVTGAGLGKAVKAYRDPVKIPGL